jgi:5'-deoxynucleotidase YfbR-like HD superfamily hydrolase
MKKLVKLLSILQLTKEQPLTGYLAAGISIHELPSLAEHQYTSALIGYFLVRKIKKAGGTIDERKLILMLLFHDLGELFGGDVAAPLSRKYPDLKVHKDKIGERTIELLSQFMDEDIRDDFSKLIEESEKGMSDEKIVSKIIDQIDHQFFFEHHNYEGKSDYGIEDHRSSFIRNHIVAKTKQIKDPITRDVVNEFLDSFLLHFYKRGFQPQTLLTEDE